MMNYLSMVPTFYSFAAHQMPSYASNTPQKEFKPSPNFLLLNAISQALSTSLKNYEQQLAHNVDPSLEMQTQVVAAEEQIDDSEKVIEIISLEEEDGQNFKSAVSEQTSKLTLRPSAQPEKPINPTFQLPTDDENLNESKETSNKKDNELKKKNRKNKFESQIQKFKVIVPEVDLIDTAYLPQTGLSYDALASKKEQLMNRRVGDWTQVGKGKKERREIRMLGN